MKSLKTLLVASLILTTSIVKSFAIGNENSSQAYSQLNAQLKEMLNTQQIGKSISNDKSCFVVVSFSVNRKHQMENIRVESTDETVANYVKRMLQQKKVEVNSFFEGKSGQVMIMMENEG
jgi:riboflavin synthase alpha subunit